ncbi:MAG: GFA family protein [Alphaproteobacteria bacterium]|nr:GFA family protein [Alphaproteobacteria bacterium]
MAAVRTGGCLCGAVRYESTGEPSFSLQCHCRDCQKSSGSAFVAAMRVPASGFRVTHGMPKRFVKGAESGNQVTRLFCGDCGSPIYIQVSSRPDIVGLRVGTLDDPSEFRPEANIFVKSAQPWVHMDPDLPRHDTYPSGKSYTGA